MFTDIEGSTKLLEQLGVDAYRDALAEHRRVVRDAFARFDGYEVDYEGDAFFYAFRSAQEAVGAVAAAMIGLQPRPIRIRVGIHTGEPALDPPKYVGLDVHRAARIMSAAHGGQVVLSPSTVALLEPGAASVRELGSHRLKDLSAPIVLHQLVVDGLPVEFPPLRTLYRSNLPVPATTFLGRQDDLAVVVERLTDPCIRLLTLTGPGGTGKTRLALQAAAEVADLFPDGVVWVPLAPLRDPKVVLPSVAQAVGAKGDLASHLGARRLLLLLDNFEHLLVAASDIELLLAACPGLVVVVTSREPLRIGGEWEYAVDPMHEREAVELFTQRACAVRADFSANGEVARICRRLDGLPLAIELAAARVKVMSPSAILERLEKRLPLLTAGSRSAPERQRTLHETIEWSFELLKEEEKRAFSRLSVFAGGCTLAAAEEICDADLDMLASLVDKSLVRHRDDRFWMLETIREFASDALANFGEADGLRSGHADWFASFVRTSAHALRRMDEATVNRFVPEHDNVRVAMAWSLEDGDARLALELIDRLAVYWILRGHGAEGVVAAERVLERPDLLAPEEQVSALTTLAEFLRFTGDPLRAIGLLERALGELIANDGESGAIIATLKDIAQSYAALDPPDLAHAHAYADDALDRARETGRLEFVAGAEAAKAVVEFVEGQFGAAKARYLRTLPVWERDSSLAEIANIHGMVGQCARREGLLEQAATELQQALAISAANGILYQVQECLQELAAIAAIRSEFTTAARLLGASERLREDVAASVWDPADFERTVTLVRSALGDDRLATIWAEARSLSTDDAVELARSVS